MRIGIPRESRPGETLVAATAKTAAQLAALGYDVVVEAGAGVAADQPDAAYEEAGVAVGSSAEVWASDVVVKVNAPTDDEVGLLRPGATVIALLAPARSPELVERLGAAGVNLLNSSGSAAWQTVFHFHMHVIPRYAGDGMQLPARPGSGGGEDEIKAAGQELQA